MEEKGTVLPQTPREGPRNWGGGSDFLRGKRAAVLPWTRPQRQHSHIRIREVSTPECRAPGTFCVKSCKKIFCSKQAGRTVWGRGRDGTMHSRSSEVTCFQAEG